MTARHGVNYRRENNNDEANNYDEGDLHGRVALLLGINKLVTTSQFTLGINVLILCS